MNSIVVGHSCCLKQNSVAPFCLAPRGGDTARPTEVRPCAPSRLLSRSYALLLRPPGCRSGLRPAVRPRPYHTNSTSPPNSSHLAIAGKSLKPSRGSPGRNLGTGPAAPQKAKTTPRPRQALVSDSESNTKYGVTAHSFGNESGEAAQVSGIRERFGRGLWNVFDMELSCGCHGAGRTRRPVEQ